MIDKNTTLKDAVYQALNKAKEILVSEHFLAPVALIFTDAGMADAINLDFKSSEDKRIKMKALQLMIQKHPEIKRVIFVAESWVTSVNKDDKVTLDRIKEEGVEPRLDKKEAIIVTGSEPSECISVVTLFSKEKGKITFESTDEFSNRNAENNLMDDLWKKDNTEWGKYKHMYSTQVH